MIFKLFLALASMFYYIAFAKFKKNRERNVMFTVLFFFLIFLVIPS